MAYSAPSGGGRQDSKHPSEKSVRMLSRCRKGQMVSQRYAHRLGGGGSRGTQLTSGAACLGPHWNKARPLEFHNLCTPSSHLEVPCRSTRHMDCKGRPGFNPWLHRYQPCYLTWLNLSGPQCSHLPNSYR